VHLETLGMRDKILAEATRLFVAQGFDGVSMREIADACGMSKAGLYYHFKDKEDLFLALLSENLNELSAILDEIDMQTDPVPEKFARFIRAVFTRLPVDHRAIIRLAGQEMHKVRPELRADFERRYYERFVGRLAGLFSQGIREGLLRDIDPVLGVWGLLGLMYPFFNPKQQIVSTAGHPRSAGEIEPVVNFIVSIFLNGVVRHG
jgi:AcrR family transcriptional regulator